MVVKRSLRNQGAPPPFVPERKSCPLCGRVLVPGPSVDEHHLVPKSQGGQVTYTVHRVCHQAIHAHLSEKELARVYNTWAQLQAHPDLVRFIEWVQKRPDDFVDRTKKSTARRK